MNVLTPPSVDVALSVLSPSFCMNNSKSFPTYPRRSSFFTFFPPPPLARSFVWQDRKIMNRQTLERWLGPKGSDDLRNRLTAILEPGSGTSSSAGPGGPTNAPPPPHPEGPPPPTAAAATGSRGAPAPSVSVVRADHGSALENGGTEESVGTVPNATHHTSEPSTILDQLEQENNLAARAVLGPSFPVAASFVPPLLLGPTRQRHVNMIPVGGSATTMSREQGQRNFLFYGENIPPTEPPATDFGGSGTRMFYGEEEESADFYEEVVEEEEIVEEYEEIVEEEVVMVEGGVRKTEVSAPLPPTAGATAATSIKDKAGDVVPPPPPPETEDAATKMNGPDFRSAEMIERAFLDTLELSADPEMDRVTRERVVGQADRKASVMTQVSTSSSHLIEGEFVDRVGRKRLRNLEKKKGHKHGGREVFSDSSRGVYSGSRSGGARFGAEDGGGTSGASGFGAGGESALGFVGAGGSFVVGSSSAPHDHHQHHGGPESVSDQSGGSALPDEPLHPVELAARLARYYERQRPRSPEKSRLLEELLSQEEKEDLIKRADSDPVALERLRRLGVKGFSADPPSPAKQALAAASCGTDGGGGAATTSAAALKSDMTQLAVNLQLGLEALPDAEDNSRFWKRELDTQLTGISQHLVRRGKELNLLKNDIR